MMGLRHGRAAAAMMRYLRGVAAALVLALGVGFVVGTVALPALAASPPVACAQGVTQASQLAPGNSCQLSDGVTITGTTTSSGQVNYGQANQAVATAIVTPLENAAAVLRMILGALCLVVVIVGLILRNMHHNQQLAQMGSMAVTRAFEALVVLAVLPFFLNLLLGFKMPLV